MIIKAGLRKTGIILSIIGTCSYNELPCGFKKQFGLELVQFSHANKSTSYQVNLEM